MINALQWYVESNYPLLIFQTELASFVLRKRRKEANFDFTWL